MVNSDNGQIINEILRSIAREYRWEEYLPQPYKLVKVEVKHFNDYAGRYLVNPDRVLAVTQEDGGLYATPTQSPKIELLSISPTNFIRRDADIQYHFVKGTSGKVDTVKIHSGGQISTAPRVAPDFTIPYEKLAAGKIVEALAAYRKIKQEDPHNFAVTENRINGLGYELLSQKKHADAIAVFRLNVELYPDAWNTYDSLGEGYMMNGDKTLAAENYKKSLALNPRNANAVAMLKKLEQ
jgi:tetratricopeptide (TPR) repeat protein